MVRALVLAPALIGPGYIPAFCSPASSSPSTRHRFVRGGVFFLRAAPCVARAGGKASKVRVRPFEEPRAGRASFTTSRSLYGSQVVPFSSPAFTCFITADPPRVSAARLVLGPAREAERTGGGRQPVPLPEQLPRRMAVHDLPRVREVTAAIHPVREQPGYPGEVAMRADGRARGAEGPAGVEHGVCDSAIGL